MKIYVDELPKSCAECEFCGRLKPPAKRPEVECMHCNMMKKMDRVSEHCHLVEFDRQECCVLGDKRMSYRELYFNCIEQNKQHFKELQALKERWEKLKEFIRGMYAKAEIGGIEECVTNYILKQIKELEQEGGDELKGEGK